MNWKTFLFSLIIINISFFLFFPIVSLANDFLFNQIIGCYNPPQFSALGCVPGYTQELVFFCTTLLMFVAGLLAYFATEKTSSWRDAILVSLACGGFVILEYVAGILYQGWPLWNYRFSYLATAALVLAAYAFVSAMAGGAIAFLITRRLRK